jgi:hypothetical protein
MQESDKPELMKMIEEMRAASQADTATAEFSEEDFKRKEEEMRSALDINGQDQIRIPIPDSLLSANKPEEIRRVPDGLLGNGIEAEPVTKDRWSRTVPELGLVTVTPNEQESFYRSYLLGDRQKIRTHIQILPGEYFECIVQALTPGEKEVLAIAVSESIKEHPLLKDATTADHLRPILRGDHWLRIEVLTRILRVEGRPEWEPYKIELGADMLPEEYPHFKELVRASKVRFHNVQIYGLLLRSLHLAAVKFTILEDALANRDFSESADAGY